MLKLLSTELAQQGLPRARPGAGRKGGPSREPARQAPCSPQQTPDAGADGRSAGIARVKRGITASGGAVTSMPRCAAPRMLPSMNSMATGNAHRQRERHDHAEHADHLPVGARRLLRHERAARSARSALPCVPLQGSAPAGPPSASGGPRGISSAYSRDRAASRRTRARLRGLPRAGVSMFAHPGGECSTLVEQRLALGGERFALRAQLDIRRTVCVLGCDFRFESGSTVPAVCRFATSRSSRRTSGWSRRVPLTRLPQLALR